MNLFLVEDYVMVRDTYNDRQSRMVKAVNRAFDEYKLQKNAVSTRPYKSWPSWRVHSFELTLVRATLTIVYYGTYGYSETKTLRLPAAVIQYAAEADGGPLLKDAIAAIIKDEGEDITRRVDEKEKSTKIAADAALAENEARILAEATAILQARQKVLLQARQKARENNSNKLFDPDLAGLRM